MTQVLNQSDILLIRSGEHDRAGRLAVGQDGGRKDGDRRGCLILQQVRSKL